MNHHFPKYCGYCCNVIEEIERPSLPPTLPDEFTYYRCPNCGAEFMRKHVIDSVSKNAEMIIINGPKIDDFMIK